MMEMENSDFRALDVSDVDLILTDPPYGDVGIYEDIAEWAAQVLKEGGFLVIYSGVYHLNDIIRGLDKHLEYYHTIADIHSGRGKSMIHPTKAMCGWKPILVYQKGKRVPSKIFIDVLQGNKRDKSLHIWQQPINEAIELIDIFSPVGGFVVDPCMGSGTVAMAAKSLNRRFSGTDIDPQAYETSKHRIVQSLIC